MGEADTLRIREACETEEAIEMIIGYGDPVAAKAAYDETKANPAFSGIATELDGAFMTVTAGDEGLLYPKHYTAMTRLNGSPAVRTVDFYK